MFKQVLQIDKKELLEELKFQMEAILQEMLSKTDVSLVGPTIANKLNSDYTNKELKELVNTIKPRYKYYFKGKAKVMLDTITLLDVYVDKRLYDYMVVLSEIGGRSKTR